MGVSTRYILAAVALAFAPVAAYADCSGCNGGSLSPSNPAVNVPGPTIGNPNFSNGGSSGSSSSGCGSPCGGGLPTTPSIVVPQPFVPAPNVVITGNGPTPEGASNINITTLIDQSVISIRGGGSVYVGGSSYGVSGGDGMALASAPAATEQRSETRVSEQVVAIQAICVDDRDTPHPASQTFGEREIPQTYEGEVFRCIAGTFMRVTLGRANGEQISYENGRVFECQRGEALVYRAGAVTCRTQEPRRQCNERSLLRRFGPGIKLVRVRIEETVTSAVEVRSQQEVVAPTQMFDGGVGQAVWQ
jgi:hypothetical protein